MRRRGRGDARLTDLGERLSTTEGSTNVCFTQKGRMSLQEGGGDSLQNSGGCLYKVYR